MRSRRPAREERSSSAFCSSSRNGEPCERRGRRPSSRPTTKTTSKRRVRARSRSSTATRPASPAPASRTRRVGEQRDDLLSRRRAAEVAPAFELGDELRGGLVRAQVEPSGLVRRRRVEPVGRAHHRAGELPNRVQRVGRVADAVEVRQRLAAKLARSPPRPAPARSRRGRAAGPRGSRRGGARAPSTASAGTRTGRAARRRARRSAAARAAPAPNGVWPSRSRPSSA